jgi:hypothetical protein
MHVVKEQGHPAISGMTLFLFSLIEWTATIPLLNAIDGFSPLNETEKYLQPVKR